MEYTFSSTLEDDYGVVYAPINYLGASTQIKWLVSYVNGKAKTVLLDTDDYIIINKTIYYVDKTYTSLDNCMVLLNDMFSKIGAPIKLESDGSGRFMIYSSQPFNITHITPKLQYALGLYYLKEVNINSVGTEIDGSMIYTYKCLATHFEYLTPIWYVISNMGTPSQISSMIDRYTCFHPAVNVKIINTFTDGQPLSISNCDYSTVSQASSLSNLRFHVVDSNLNPIKFLSPIYITITVDAYEMDPAIMEALGVQEPNANYMKIFEQYLKKNYELMATLLGKTENGVDKEPDMLPLDFKPQENQPKHIYKVNQDTNTAIMPDEIVGNIDKTLIIRSEDVGTKDDDRTQEKETSMIEKENVNIEEQQIKVDEETKTEN